MRKQSSRNEDWIKLFKICQYLSPESRLNELEAVAVRNIRLIAKEGGFAYGYSGGKDSVVIKHLIQEAGLGFQPCFSAVYHNEYPAMREFIRQTAPENTIYIQAKDYTFDYLNAHPEFLFPEEENKKVVQLYTKAWRDRVPELCKALGTDMMITGRRLEDGNHCGKKVSRGLYTSRNKDVISWNIIAEWNHADVLAYIKSRGLPMAPIYEYPNGYKLGTHAWIERPRINGSISQTFDEIWNHIDKGIVISAASGGLLEAQKYLKEKGI